MESKPKQPVGKDDKCNMYNASSRAALFRALTERKEFAATSRCFRAFYSKAARIFLVRGEGELVLPWKEAAAIDAIADAVAEAEAGGTAAPSAEAADDDDELCAVCDTDDANAQAAAVRVIRSCRGTHQGCVLGTFGACMPYHLSLHRTNKECPKLRIVCDADDTSVGGPRKSFYADFATLRRNAFRDCDLLSTLPKIRVFNPLGGVQGHPRLDPGGAGEARDLWL